MRKYARKDFLTQSDNNWVIKDPSFTYSHSRITEPNIGNSRQILYTTSHE